MDTHTLPTVANISPKGNWTTQNKIEFFEGVLKSTLRPGMNGILETLRKTDFYKAPSSANKHCNYVGGLLDHSILVFSLAMREREVLIEMNPELEKDLKEDSVAIATLLHDVCKIAFYKTAKKFKKDAEGRWVTYEGYEIDDRFPIGHGEKSVIMLLKWGLDLSPEEMLAIRFHMGMWEVSGSSTTTAYSYNNAIDSCPLLALVESADYKSSLLMEDMIER
jgi:hypothetical protein